MVLLASPSAEIRRRWRLGLGRLATREARDRARLELLFTELKPRVVLLDLALPGLRGAEDLVALQRLSPASRIVLLAATPSEPEGLAAFRAGARGYCHREIDPGLLAKAVEVVQKGEIWAGRALISRLVEALAARTRQAGQAAATRKHPRLAVLTRREREIALLVAGGGANKEIAARAGVTERTVKAHLTTIFRKLGVSDRLRLALLLSGGTRLVGDGTDEPGPKSNLRAVIEQG
jgi:DNA-binding NarL/FixJ family response regulator